METTNVVFETTALKVNQHDRTLYQFSLSADRVHSLIASGKLDIDKWSPSNPNGYQRTPTESRLKNFGKFVMNQEGISPTAVLISVRGKNGIEIENGTNKDTVHLKINLQKVKFYVPDGQHRLWGLNWAVEQDHTRVLDYSLPAILFIAEGEDPKYDEAVQFNTINTLAKRVKTDLAERYMLQKRERELGQLKDRTSLPDSATLKELEPFGVKIADFLNAETNGPLCGKIAPPNAGMFTASITQSSFVESIKPFLAVASKLHWDIGKTKETLDAFWIAIRNKCPKASEHWTADSCKETGNKDHFSALLMTTTGMFSLHDILARSLWLPSVSAAPTNAQTFKKLLDKRNIQEFFEDGKDGYWSTSSANDNSASNHGTSRKSFKAIADEIWSALMEE